jgi:hypothetical protein
MLLYRSGPFPVYQARRYCMNFVPVILLLMFVIMVALGCKNKEYTSSSFWFQLLVAFAILALYAFPNIRV